ncbi:hypothetical protein SLA2020_051240 [Shorea laevis]
MHNWVKQNIFWELPYWEDNLIRHNLDVMHYKKNFFDNIIHIVMDNPFSKDNVKSRLDLPLYCDREELHLYYDRHGSLCKPNASYALNTKHKNLYVDGSNMCNFQMVLHLTLHAV